MTTCAANAESVVRVRNMNAEELVQSEKGALVTGCKGRDDTQIGSGGRPDAMVYHTLIAETQRALVERQRRNAQRESGFEFSANEVYDTVWQRMNATANYTWRAAMEEASKLQIRHPGWDQAEDGPPIPKWEKAWVKCGWVGWELPTRTTATLGWMEVGGMGGMWKRR